MQLNVTINPPLRPRYFRYTYVQGAGVYIGQPMMGNQQMTREQAIKMVGGMIATFVVTVLIRKLFRAF